MTRNIDKPVFRWGCSILIALFATVADGIAQETGVARSSSHEYPEVTIPNTELRTIHSHIVGQEFNIYIQLPGSYHADTTAIYPVLYAIDANRAFPMVANISSVVAFPKGILPEIIVVGIGYPISDMTEWAAWRTRDLTPIRDTVTDSYWDNLLAKMTHRRFKVESGGASRFLEFIVKELIPFMESNYRVSHSDRALAGYSYGGLFALYSLFTYPEVFGRYFAGSPSLGYGDEFLFKYENEFAASGKRLKAKIFMSVGSTEDSLTISYAREMFDRLQSRYRPGVEISFQVFEGEDHRSCMAAALMRAFRVLYGP